jgi:hypothetical protein
MAGYSGTLLVKKLGIKPDARVFFARLDFALLFVTDRVTLAKRFTKLAARLQPAGMLWVAWPKKASGVPTDLTENVVRDTGLDAGLVDVKVCAIDDTWSGLKFVYRLKDRNNLPRNTRNTRKKDP